MSAENESRARKIFPRAIDSLVGEPAFAISIHDEQAIGIEVSGLVIVKTPEEWHRLAIAADRESGV